MALQEEIKSIEMEITHLQQVRQDRLSELEDLVHSWRADEAPRYVPNHLHEGPWSHSVSGAGYRPFRSGSLPPSRAASPSRFGPPRRPPPPGFSGGPSASGMKPDTLRIVLRSERGDRVHGELRPTVRLAAVQDIYCQRRKLPQGSVDFYFNGRRLDPHSTAEEALDGCDGATIDVVQKHHSHTMRPPQSPGPALPR